MEIREIIYVKTIADFGNLTKASKYLHITQPTLSQNLKNIESNLNQVLFTRTKRGMTLTEQGKRFIDDALPVLSAYQEFMNRINSYKDESPIRHIGLYKLSYTTFINNTVMNFISINHNDRYMIKVESIPILEKLVLQNQLDIAIIKYSPICPRDKNLIHSVLFREKLCVLLSKKHPLASKKSIKLHELKGNKLITSDPTEYPYKMTKKILNDAGLKLDIHTYTNYENLTMIFDLVAQGLGITFGTEYVCDYFNREDVVKIPIDENYDYEVCVVYKNNDSRYTEFINFIKNQIKKKNI